MYPTGIKGTRDWTRVEAITRLPEDATSCNVACYVRRNPDVPFDVQWSGLKRVAAEIDQRSSVLLSVGPVPAVTVAGAASGWLHWRARAQAGRLYLFVVNDGDGEGKVALKLPGTPKVVRELGEKRTIETDGATLQLVLPRLAVQCYEIEPEAQ